jgi:hypothetical protein
MVRRGIRRYVIFAVAAPLVGRQLVKQADAMRVRSGNSQAADRLERVGSLLQRGGRRRRR